MGDITVKLPQDARGRIAAFRRGQTLVATIECAVAQESERMPTQGNTARDSAVSKALVIRIISNSLVPSVLAFLIQQPAIPARQKILHSHYSTWQGPPRREHRVDPRDCILQRDFSEVGLPPTSEKLQYN